MGILCHKKTLKAKEGGETFAGTNNARRLALILWVKGEGEIFAGENRGAVILRQIYVSGGFFDGLALLIEAGKMASHNQRAFALK